MAIRLLILSERLRTIAGFIEEGSDVADIGTGHGHLPVYLAQKGLARRIFASDVSVDSLEAARVASVKYGVEDRIKFIASPGLTGLSESDADTIVLSGMGGETISHILADAPWTKRCGIRLILQPQTKIGKLCFWLRENGYIIKDAELTRDKGRFYIVILSCPHMVRRASDPIFLEPEIELLTVLAGKNDPCFNEYIDELFTKAFRAAEGMKAAGSPDYPRMAKSLEDLAMFKRRAVINGSC